MVSVTGYFDVAEASVWGRESNRLRHAILQLKLEEAHNSVQQALEDLCVLAEPQTSDEHERKAVLRHALESVGLTFCQDHELPIPGYLSLSWPDRLFRVYPQLGALHPLAWHMLHVA
jgi:hypothetical protein